MDHVGKSALRKGKSLDVAYHTIDGRMSGYLRSFMLKSPWVPSEDCDCGVKIQGVVGEEKGFKEPTSKKPCATGDENSSAAKLFPQISGVIKNMRQIFNW